MRISKFEYELVKLYILENLYIKNINRIWKEAFQLNYDNNNNKILNKKIKVNTGELSDQMILIKRNVKSYFHSEWNISQT